MRATVAVFGSHSPKPGNPDYALAKEVGSLLASAGFAVATGGYEGTMAGVSEGASLAGGHVIGVTSTRVERNRGTRLNSWVTEEIKYDSLPERLLHLVTNNDAMIVLPGGVGTLSELALAWNLIQVAQLPLRPLVLLGSMWQETLNAFIRPEFVEQKAQELIKMAETPEQAVEFVKEALASA